MRARQLILDQIGILEEERVKLIQAQATLTEQAEGDLGTLDEELEKLQALWPKYTFEKRRSLMNFIIKEVVIEAVSTHWMRVEVFASYSDLAFMQRHNIPFHAQHTNWEQLS